jgi:hypothetical protein
LDQIRDVDAGELAELKQAAGAKKTIPSQTRAELRPLIDELRLNLLLSGSVYTELKKA